MENKHIWSLATRKRFWAKVKKTETCWWWTASKGTDGYGVFSTGLKTERGNWRLVGAHRFSYLLAHNLLSLPYAIDCLHSCDNKLCVRPSHLTADTRRANVLDCYAKGRARTGCRPGVPRAVLTPAQVIDIRTKFTSGEYTRGQLSREYRVHRKAISNILNEKSWKGLLSLSSEIHPEKT